MRKISSLGKFASPMHKKPANMSRARNQKLQTATCILFLTILSACGQASPTTPTPTATTAPTGFPTSTFASIPTSTNTPEPTPTKEINQFKQCSAENFTDCKISPNDLLNGNYYKWLQTLSKPFENQPDFTQLSVEVGKERAYYLGSPFDSIETAPVRRGVTYSYTEAEVEWDDGSKHQGSFVVMPVEFAIPNKPNETKWVVFIMEIGWNYSPQFYSDLLNTYFENGKLLLSGSNGSSTSNKNSILRESVRKFPDVQERIEQFAETLDASYISEPGMVLRSSALR